MRTRRTTMGIVETQPRALPMLPGVRLHPTGAPWGAVAADAEVASSSQPRPRTWVVALRLPKPHQLPRQLWPRSPGREGGRNLGTGSAGPAQGASSGPLRSGAPHPPRGPFLGPDAPLRYPSGASLPAALRTTRCSMPGGPEAAPVTTATATQNARARAAAPIVGARATTSSGGARGHAAPHVPALAPAGGGRHSGDCGRRWAVRYPGGAGARRGGSGGGWAPAPRLHRPPAAPPAAAALGSRAAWRRPPPPRRGPSLPPPSLPDFCRALPGRRRRRRQTFQDGKPAPRPGPAAETARDVSPPRAPASPRARLYPSPPAHRPGGRRPPLAARGPCSGSLPASPVPASRASRVGSPVRPCARRSRTARRQLSAPPPPPPPPPSTEPGRPGARQPVGAGPRPPRPRPRPGPAPPAPTRWAQDTPLPWGSPEAGPRLAGPPPAEGIRGGGAGRGRRAVSEGVGAGAGRARPPIAPLRQAGAQRGRARTSSCAARSPGCHPASDQGNEGT